MRLLFLRHGPTEAKSEWHGDDEARPLSAQGRLLVQDVALSLVRQQTRPTVILTSPYLRATQTAQIVSESLGDGTQVVVDDRLAPGLGAKQLAKLLRSYGDAGVLMLIGHDPDLSELVRALTGGGRLVIRKAGLAEVDVPDPKVMKGRLVSLLVPTPANFAESQLDLEP